MTFKDLEITPSILSALEDLGYTEPTPIQEQAIPKVLNRKDLIACAQTGTGKTAAFAVPMIQLIQKIECDKNKPTTLRGLILTPTRELAIQIEESIRDYGKNTDVKHTVIYGGVKQHKQVARMKK